MTSLLQITNDTKHSVHITCPHCKSSLVVKYGKYKGRQRYRCNYCGRTFNDFSGTFLSGTHYADKWALYINEMLSSSTLRNTAVKLSISHVTAFYWRHKLLKHLNDDFNGFKGVVELCRKIIPLNKKGIKRSGFNNLKAKRNSLGGLCLPDNLKVRVAFLKDRYGNCLIINEEENLPYHMIIKNVIEKNLNENEYLCSNEEGILKRICRNKNIIFKRASSMEDEGKIYHIKNVINYKNMFINWLINFRGVSTKYLKRYISWFKKLYEFGFQRSNLFLEKFFRDLLLNSETTTYKSIKSI